MPRLRSGSSTHSSLAWEAASMAVLAAVGMLAPGCKAKLGAGASVDAGGAEAEADASADTDANTAEAEGTTEEPERVAASESDNGSGSGAHGSPQRATGEGSGSGAHGKPSLVSGGPSAVCRVGDAALLALCHRALDPIAAGDEVGFFAVLHEDAAFVTPAWEAEGADGIREATGDAGDLRTLVNANPGDQIVGALKEDCRSCARATATFSANTRSGKTLVTLDLTQPPRIIEVRMDSSIRKRAPMPPRTVVFGETTSAE